MWRRRWMRWRRFVILFYLSIAKLIFLQADAVVEVLEDDTISTTQAVSMLNAFNDLLIPIRSASALS
jgi:hypothetical protein